MEKSFEIKKSLLITLATIAIIGILIAFLGVLTNNQGASSLWSSVLLNAYFVTAIAAGCAFFVLVHNLADSGWHTALIRIPESIATFFPVAGLLMLLILPGLGEIYHWTHPQGDALLEAKTPFLNTPFFIIRLIIYYLLWSLMFLKIWQQTKKMDTDNSPVIYKNLKRLSGVFIVLFVSTFYFASIDWIMTIDPHWYSSLFGFFLLSGAVVMGVSAIIIILITAQYFGYFQHVKTNHLHDLGKYLFGFSIFWGYLWGSQYLLIWYSNIPEESVYYVERLTHFPELLRLSVVLSFIVPLMGLMTAGSKKNKTWLLIMAIVVLVGQWINLYVAVKPGSTGENASINLFDIGTLMLFVSLLVYVTFRSLTKIKQVPINHPFMHEALMDDELDGDHH